ncbi:LysR family transcriptional regulator [Spongiibacter sp. KMU-158]|uniref:LysR family transcriptional regulator n=1 Tax=Spongiibacter pelagi TaxID=2760804 RepID=A0A927C122_9GAMM|nr:LysR family transcriptional regulator [Spongiibacter pelagi]MBD2858067.1 LysR family transcriptional regulator [Spongiibacter pelagi]
MNKIDFLSLDGRSLRTFLMVLEERSISKAAARLGVTQSAVSHLLDKLRLTLGDPLFVRAGRGIVPTERATALQEPVRAVLDSLKSLTDERVFDPRVSALEFTIAANDFQRELIFPELNRRLLDEGIDVRFRFTASGNQSLELLQEARCQLVVTPYPPEGPNIFQTRLFDDKVVCFYDATKRQPPKSRAEFLEADYIEVRFSDEHTAMKTVRDHLGKALQQARTSVPNFSAVAAFLKGSDRIATLPSLMSRVNMQDFDFAPLPFKSPPLTMYMTWHRRDHLDPANQWLRQRMLELMAEIL